MTQTISKTDLKDLIGNFNDILKRLGIDDSFLPFKNPKNMEERSLNAQAKIFKITAVYNEGWEPIMGDSSQAKYTPYKRRWGVGVCLNWDDCVGSPLGIHFKSSEDAKDALKKFEDIYDDYFMIAKK